jgi:LCP family protein required for cell wall assembly
MLSIPRDLYVEYPNKYKVKNEKWKINWLYAKYSFKSNSKKIWMDVLKNKITQITWEKIDYFINIDFNWFKKIIDTIWGIEITIPKQFVDNRYPDWNWWYRTLIFKKWTWIFDWENALKYARSRHSTSDFDRSIRQQQVIKAIKDKLTWSYFITSPWKIKELYKVFEKYIYTDIKLSTLLKIVYALNWTHDYKIISSNLNDSCFYWSDTCSKWWFLYTPNRSYFWWMSVLLPNWTNSEKLNNYSTLQKYINIVFNYPNFFKENYKINIFNSLKINHLAWSLSNDLIKYWFNIPKINSIWNTDKIYNKSTIFYNWIDENSTTIKLLKQFTNAIFIKTDFPKYSKDWANIEIIIWEDYLSDNNPFKF